jgi:hypothetical protein
VNEAEPDVALGKVRGDAPTNAGAVQQHSTFWCRSRSRSTYCCLGRTFFLALQLTFSTRLPAYCLLIFLSHVLITKTPTFVIAGLYHSTVSCGVVCVSSVTRPHAASGTKDRRPRSASPSPSAHRSMTTLGPLKQRMTESE